MSLVRNPSFETAGPECWAMQRYGTNNGVGSRVTDPRTGSYAWRITTTSYTSGDSTLATHPTCALPATVGKPVTVSVWYKGATARTRIAIYIPNGTGGWKWWAESPTRSGSTGWTQLTWTTPPMTAGQYRIGLMQTAAGTVTFDDVTAQ